MDDLVGLPNDLFARNNTSDYGTWEDTFLEERAWHRYPTWLQTSLDNYGLIVDLGANVGYTAYDYYYRCDARIIAVEPDKENYSMLVLNLNGCIDIETVNKAVSNVSGYGMMTGMAANAMKLNLDMGDIEVCLLDDIVWREIQANKPIHFIKFDIEGSEKEVINHGGDWVELTKCMKIELHDGYTKEECARKLDSYGFIVEEDKTHDWCLLAYK